MPAFLSAMESVLLYRRDTHPHETFLKWKDEEITWEALVDRIYAMAAGFWDVGIRPGDRVAMMMGNCPEFLYTFWALTLIGVGVVSLNVAQRDAALAYILNDSSTSAIVIDDSLLNHFTAIKERVPEVRLTIVRETASLASPGTLTLAEWLKTGGGRPPIDTSTATPAEGIQYTSGTTGPPKGVINKGINPVHIMGLWKPTGVRPGETIYTCLPLFHGNALAVSALGAILLDYKLALGERFSASRHWEECRKYNAVEFNALGAMIPILLKQPARADDADTPVRVILSQACPVYAWRTFEERFHLRIIEWFGMIDAPGFLINTTGKVGSMGKPLPDFAFRVVDDEDHNVPAGKVGEIVFRTSAGKEASFYYGNEAATTTAWRNDWFHSGDLAWVDEDGDYHYAGRKKASIRRRGENISAWEIESVVNQHPAVLEAAAHAVSSELAEDEIKLVIVLKPEQTVTPAEILDFCQGKMAYYAIPRYVEFRNALPKTSTQRIEYNMLKQDGLIPQTWDREAARYVVVKDR